MDSPHSPTPIEGEQQSLDSPDSSQSSGLSFGHRRNLLPTRRLIDFEPLRQPNTTYQHGRDSPVWGQQQPLDPRDAQELPQPSFQPEDPFLSDRRPIDFEPLRQPSPTYQHGRNSPVWGQQQPLDSPDAPELPQPSFQFEDPFLQTRRLLDFELFRQPNGSPRHGQGFPFWGQEQYFETPDALSPPEFDIVYSNGWIHEIPIRPMDYEYRMLPIQPSPQGRDSPVSGGSEPLSINGPDPFQDTRKSKRRITHGRSMSIERACKAWAYELANSAPNSNQIDANTKDLFASLENLVLRLVNNQPSTEAPPQPSVKRPPNRYKISKRTRDEPPEPRVDVEDLPYWLRPRLGIRLPPGMVNLLQLHLPVYLVREFEDSLRYLPSKLSFKENSPFGTVIPKKGQVGIHPAFRTATPEDILMAEKALELSKERQFLTPEEAWRSPIIEDRNSDAGSGSLTAYKPMTDDGTAGSTNKFQGFEHWRSENHTLTTDDCTTGPANKSQGVEHWELENHSCSVDGERSKPKSSEQEAFPDFDQALIFSDQGMESPIEDQASVCLNQSRESPDIGPVTMFSGRAIETDQGSIFLSQGMQTPIVGPVSMLYSLDMESPIEDQVAMASDQGMESPIENQDSEYFGQGMEYLIEDVVSRYFRDSTESPAEDQVSVYSDQLEAFPDVDPALMFYGQDIEHLVEDQDSMPSTISIESPLLMHEGIPIIRWFYESGDGNSGSLGQPSSNQGKKTKEYYKRNSADFAHLPPIDFTKSYKHFCTTPFSNLVTDGGLEDYNSTDEETVQKTTEVTENPRVPTDTYGPEDHEARMQDLFTEIEQEGAALILTTWQEVYAERAEEKGTEEEQAEAALEDSQEKITLEPKIIQEPAVSLERRRSKTKSWFEGLPAEKEDIKERRRTQGAELELNGKRISWPGGLASARDGQTHESFEDSIGYVTQGPADLLVQKNSKRVTWFGGLPAERQKRTDEAFGDSQEKIDPGLGHPLERKRSKRTSWFGGHPAKNEERSKENLGGSHEKLTPASVHPLERKGSKRRSWFPGYSAERVEQTKKGLEDSQGKLTPSVHPLERKGSKRRSWFPGHSAERVEQTKEGLEDSQGKLTPASVHSLERKGSKRRSWFPGHSAERVEQAKEGLDGSQGKSTPASVHPLERKSSKRRSWFPGHPAEREGRASEDSHGKLIHGNVHALARKGSERRSWFPGYSVEGEGRTSEDSYGKLTQGNVHPLERKGSKRRSWFPGHPIEGEGRASEDSYGKSTQGNVHPLERKASKRKTWFGGLPPEREERTEGALEDSHGKATQEPVHPLERKRSKRMSWFGGVPVKRDEQTHEAFEGSTETIGQGPAELSEKMRAKRVSWFGGLPTQRERTERRTTQGGQEERKRKRTSWFA
ncbi:hypothetical protein V502_11334 [Pseudogymnoascus sp. VKM F-4520 (FW-2644)]|nr:hypothetical protein V502_11334 [Pseudogymnoascus sp. VKM F-4520 (FW-2644)]